MLGTKIKEHRIRKELTQGQLGDLIGVGQSTIAMYESGKITPSWSCLVKLSTALSVPLHVFIPELESSLLPVPA